MVIKVLFLFVFFSIMLGVGFYCRKKATSVNGFVLGGHSAGPWLTAFAFGTSYFSAVIFVGYAGKFGWNFGVASTWIGLGNAFIGSLMAWVILGRRTRIMTHHLSSKTMPDFFGERYKSKGLKLSSSIIVFVFLIPYTASLFNGLSRLFTMAFPGVDYFWCVIVMSILTGIYVMVGGYMATAINDFIQGLFMIVGIVAVIITVLNQNGGFMGSIEKLATESGWEYTSFFGADPLFLFFVIILTSLGTWGLPQMVGKFYAIKSEDAIKKGTIISTVFAIIVAGGCYFLGGFSRLFSESVNGKPAVGYDNLIPNMLVDLGPVIIGIVLVLVLSASMSTLSSLVLASGSTITLDLIVPLRKKDLSETKKMLIMRVFIAFFIVVSALIAIYQKYSPSESSVSFIADLMGVSWGVLAGAFIAPFLYGLYLKGITKFACYISFFVGVAIGIIQLVKSIVGFSFGVDFLDNLLFKSSIHSGSFAMIIGLAIVPLISLVTKKLDQAEVDKMFNCYNREIVVKAKEVLEED